MQIKYRYKIYKQQLKNDTYACQRIHINYTTQHIIATGTGAGAVLTSVAH